MKQADAIDALRRSARILQSSDDAGAQMVGKTIADWIESNATLPFETFIGLANGQSERKWQTTHALELRNELLRDAACQFFPNLIPTRQADEISPLYNRYRAIPWARGECDLDECPIKYLGTVRELFWKALKLHDASLGVERIRKILVTS